MHTFFHGWRRKTGCVTLVLAGAMMGLWLRSQLIQDVFVGAPTGITEVVVSDSGVISWWRIATEQPKPFAWARNTVTSFNGSCVVNLGSRFMLLEPSDSLAIPYWTFVLPLTLLSAGLILWRPPQGP